MAIENPVPQDVSPETAAAEFDGFDQKISEHMDALPRVILNAQWEDGFYHLDRIQALVKDIPGERGEVLRAIHDIFRHFTLGFQLYIKGQSEQDSAQALDHLKGAKQMLLEMREKHTEFTRSPGFKQMSLGVEAQLIGVMLTMPAIKQDPDQYKALVARRDLLVKEMLPMVSPEERHYLEGITVYLEALPIFSNSMAALRRLDLEDAQRYIQQANALLARMEESLSKTASDALLLEAPKGVARGFALLSSALETYVETLYAAIAGDVTKAHLQELQMADAQLVQSADLFSNWGTVLPGMPDEVVAGLRQAVEYQRQITRNLRRLCEMSLTPKAISRSASPRFVIYFLGTFLILLFALPVSGLIARLDFFSVGALVVISFTAGLVATFGFEALRFTRWLEIFGNALIPFRPKQSGDS